MSRDVPLKRVYTGAAQTGRRMRILAAYFGLRGRVYNLRWNGMDSRAIHSTPENHPSENGSSTRGCLPIEPFRANGSPSLQLLLPFERELPWHGSN